MVVRLSLFIGRRWLHIILPCFIIWLSLANTYGQSILNSITDRQFHDLPQGLSQKSVNTIFQDYRGFIWVGTDDGLNKFDGYGFTIYKHDPTDAYSIGHSHIRSIQEDGTDGLWIGTERGGLNHYSFLNDRFITYDTVIGNGLKLSDCSIYDMVMDESGLLWIGTNKGLVIYNPANGTFGQNDLSGQIGSTQILDLLIDQHGIVWIGTDGDGLYIYNKAQKKLITVISRGQGTISSNYVRKIYESSVGIIWIGTSKGLNRYERSAEKFIRFDDLSSNDIWAIAESATNEIFVGTDGGGLNIVSKGNASEFFVPEDIDQFSINDNVIRELYKDRQGNMWIGMFRGGINLLHSENNKFKVFRKGLKGLNHSSVISLEKHGSEGLWIGTDGGGLNHLDLKTGSFSYNEVTKTAWDPEFDNVLLSLLEDHEGGLWTGTYEGGLKYYQPQSRIPVRFIAGQTELLNNSVLTLHQDRNRNIWIGTNGGINLYDWESKVLSRIENHKATSLIDNEKSVRTIYEDSRGDLWFGVLGGLKKIHPDKRQLIEYSFDGYHGNYMIYSICEDSDGNFWLGTYGGGLLLFNPEHGIKESYRIVDGLPSDVIYGIIKDRKGDLWLSTGSGISKYDTSSKVFRNYNVNDGLQGNQFNRGACLSDELGYIWFGGINGLNVFHPDSIRDNLFTPPVVFTDLKIFNQPLHHSDSSKHISSHINSANIVELDHSQSVITFEFASLNYVFPDRNQYAFQLEGFDNDWRYTTNREATYTNLDPGFYTFKVKSANNDGIWNEEAASINLIVHPPWWKTWWAYTGYFLLVILLLFLARKMVVLRERLKTNLKLEHLQLTHLQEIDHMKSRFFANISHELRTPLTLILDPLRMMYDREAHPKVQKQLKMMIRNAQRLLRLINQLLDLSKLEEGKLNLVRQKIDLVHWLRQLLPAFRSFAEHHKIHFLTELPNRAIVTSFDPDKMEKIITNLLSNALKFTHDGGEVKITVRCHEVSELPDWDKDGDRLIEIRISDNGVGIPEERIRFVFDRFYQVDGAHHREQEGAGIGLSLTKELVELHGGEIRVQSKENKGTVMSVFIPLDFSNDIEPKTGETTTPRSINNLEEHLQKTNMEVGDNRHKIGTNVPLILVIEDNTDVNCYICSCLNGDYRVISAVNGKEGLQMAIDQQPDLIISDIMMPLMDGIEMTAEIKKEKLTSHIPVILLTAKAEDSDIYAGLDTGADDYIVKPFDMKLLKKRVGNMIRSRQQLREMFSSSKMIKLEPKEVTASPLDEMFLKTAMESIENNMSNSEYTVEDFGNDVNLSRMQLYRKLKALTGQSPNEFIRTIRLKRAAQLLQLNELTVSQITYEVGFNDLQYFRDCFKKHFGVNPSHYSQNYTITSDEITI